MTTSATPFLAAAFALGFVLLTGTALLLLKQKQKLEHILHFLESEK